MIKRSTLYKLVDDAPVNLYHWSFGGATAIGILPLFHIHHHPSSVFVE